MNYTFKLKFLLGVELAIKIRAYANVVYVWVTTTLETVAG